MWSPRESFAERVSVKLSSTLFGQREGSLPRRLIKTRDSWGSGSEREHGLEEIIVALSKLERGAWKT